MKEKTYVEDIDRSMYDFRNEEKDTYKVKEGLTPAIVEQISKEIAQYVEAQNCPYAMIEDRGEAIKAAMDEAEGKTIFLITGKGNETRQKYGCEYLDCKSDTQYVKEYLAEYDKKHQ